MREERNIEYDDKVKAYFADSKPMSRKEMMSCVWRFNNLTPSPRAFLDCALPGHVRTLYSALGAGTDDEQLEGTAVEQALNYHIDFIKAEPGNGAALHSHGSEETFIALTGEWEVACGDHGEEAITLQPFDGIVLPPGVMRSFSNVGSSEATLMAVLGAHNVGHVTWARKLKEPFGEAAS